MNISTEQSTLLQTEQLRNGSVGMKLARQMCSIGKKLNIEKEKSPTLNVRFVKLRPIVMWPVKQPIGKAILVLG
ncbi:hypothetical protein NL526_28660, partial [Klebsiella pneumoniae]|nr:hypothetical protein [Klebsiella pneumoniae]